MRNPAANEFRPDTKKASPRREKLLSDSCDYASMRRHCEIIFMLT